MKVKKWFEAKMEQLKDHPEFIKESGLLELEASMFKSGMKHERQMIIAEIRAMKFPDIFDDWECPALDIAESVKQEIADRIKKGGE